MSDILSRKNLNYLNMTEIKKILKKNNIPFNIYYKNNKDILVNSGTIESKKYLLNKIYSFLNGNKKLKKIIYSNKIIRIKKFKNKYTSKDKLLFGDFKSTNKNILNFLKSITNDKFRFGAIAFIEAHKIWRKDKLITLEEYSKIWIKAIEDFKIPYAEWAYMTYLNNGFEQTKWKDYRKKKLHKL